AAATAAAASAEDLIGRAAVRKKARVHSHPGFFPSVTAEICYCAGIEASRSLRVRASTTTGSPPCTGYARMLPSAPDGSSAARQSDASHEGASRSSESVAK